MFSKLLKYDFKAMKRFGFPLLFGIAGAAIVGALAAFVLSRTVESSAEGFGLFLLITGSTMLLLMTVIMLAVAFSAITVMIYVNFYKSLVTDEGYLTFTLPVQVKDIIRAKLLNGVLWMIMVGLAIVAAFALILTPMNIWGEFSLIFEDAFFSFKSAPLLAVLYLLFIPTATVNTLLLYFVAIFFGSVIAKKNKLLASIGCVLGINFVYSMGSGIVSVIVSLLFGSLSLFGGDVALGMCLLIGFYVAALTGLNVLFYYLLKHMMEKRLNLA